MVRFQFIKNILEIILIVTCVIGIAMLGGEWVLGGYFNDLNVTISSLQNRYAETNKTVKTLNEKLKRIDFIQNLYQPVSPLLPDIATAMPDDANLTALNLNLKNKNLSLTGFAANRDDLLILQSRLEKIAWIQTVDIPVDQLTKKDNINFSFSAAIK
ncbi:MAG: PilN domain-containing protein [Candidatus Magasanikbacteria bacterium]|nr:PilN domain-containing protein [Candidatus Magasanikbacteria bacterium]